MKSKIYSTACAIALSAIMTVQTLGPAASLVIADTIDEEPEVTVESTVTNDDEDPVIVVESSDETTSSDPEYVEETTDLTETTTDETSDEEEIVSTATNTDPTDAVETEETEAVDETITETEESEVTEPTDEELDEELEEELEEIEYIEFDHYYSEINEAAVSTSDLFVITGDSSVFTRNTNVVSNYDDAYIIECSSVEEARFVYSYYIDKVEFITDMSAVVSVATDDEADLDTTEPVDVTEPLEEDTRNIPDEEVLAEETQDYVDESTPDTEETTAETTNTDETVAETTEPVEQEPDLADLSDLNNGNDAISNLNDIDTVHVDYNGYIALIDTGAYANEMYSVTGDDSIDSTGHGARMLDCIREYNPSAQVVSIKVSDNGLATVADIYAGVRLAIDLGVSYINFSMYAPNIAANSAIRDILQEAINAGITVVGAAGNNSISATHFVPGCIDEAVIIGACNASGTKKDRSNYDADYYVVADSTSEAAAFYTGLLTSGNYYNGLAFNLVFDTLSENPYQYVYDTASAMTAYAIENDLGYIVEPIINEDGSIAYQYVYDEEFISANAEAERTWSTISYNGNIPTGTYTGTCTVVSAGTGAGSTEYRAYASGFQGNNAFSNVANTLGNVPIVCSKAYVGVIDGVPGAENYARNMPAGTCNYQAVVNAAGEVTLFITNGRDASISCTMNLTTAQRTTYYTGSSNVTSVTTNSSGEQIYTLHITVGIAQHAEWSGGAEMTTDQYVTVIIPRGSTSSERSTLITDAITSALNRRYSAKIRIFVDGSGVGSFTFEIENLGSQRFAGRMTPGITEAAICVRKIDESGRGLAGATFCLTGALDPDWSAEGVSGRPTYSNNRLTFQSGTGLAVIHGLLPNTLYTLEETAAPSADFERVTTTVQFQTNADGVPSPVSAVTAPWSWNSGSATFTLVNNGGQPGGISFYKVDTSTGDDTTVITHNAGIEFYAAPTNTVPNAMQGLTCTPGSGVTNWGYDSAGTSAGYPRVTFYTPDTSNGLDMSIDGLKPGATYIFHEFDIPEGSMGANDITVHVRIDGTVEVDGNVTTAVYMNNSGGGHGIMGSIGIFKTVDLNDPELEQQFWSNVNSINFSFYYFSGQDFNSWVSNGYRNNGWSNGMWRPNYVTDGTMQRSFSGGLSEGGRVEHNFVYSWSGTRRDWYDDPSTMEQEQIWYDRACTYYELVRPDVTSSTETNAEQNIRNAPIGYVRWNVPSDETISSRALNNSNYGGQYSAYPGRWWTHYNGSGWDRLTSTTNMSHLPAGVYVITESWQQGLWRQYSNTNNIENMFVSTMNADPAWHRLSNTNSREQLYALLCYVDSEGNTYVLNWDNGSIIAQFDREVDDWVANPNPIYNYYGTRTVTNIENTGSLDVRKVDLSGAGVDGVSFEVYTGNTLIATGTLSDTPTGTEDGTEGSADVYDVSWDYYTTISHNFQWRDSQGYDVGYIWDDDSSETLHETESAQWAITQNDTQEVNQHWQNQASVNSLPYGMYQVREILPANNNFAVPEGWNGVDANNDGVYEYFWQNVTVNANYQSTPLTVTARNRVIGMLDVSKVNLTGGPLHSLAFEIRNEAGRVVATGEIPEDAEPATIDSGALSDYTYSVLWTYTRNGDVIHNDIYPAGIGTFEIRELIPNSVTTLESLQPSEGWNGPFRTSDGLYYYFSKTITVTNDDSVGVICPELTNAIRPQISTTMTDFAGQHITVVGEDIEFTDVVTYEGAWAEGLYIMHAVLMDADTHEVLLDANGEPYGADRPFTASEPNGEVSVTFTVNTADLVTATEDANGVVTYSPRNVVCFEELRLPGEMGLTIAEHSDFTDAAQTVTVPNPIIGTTFTSVQDIRDDACIGETVEFIDTVTYENLHANELYSLRARIYDADTGAVIRNTDGTPFEATITFRPEASSGTVEVPIEINTASIIEADLDDTTGIVTMHAKNIVCYEYLYSASGILISGHTDRTDENQILALTPPEIHTTFVDVQTEEHETVSGRVVEVVDTVTYTNLHVGETYNLTCYLFDQATGVQLVYSNGDPVVATQEFLAETENGTVQVKFTIDTSDLQVNFFNYVRHTYVAFEYLRTSSDILIAGHTAIDDHYQWVTPNLPIITTAVIDDQSGTQEGRLGSEVPFTDTVYYNNLNEGEWYQIRGRVVSQDNANQVWATNTVDFQATGRSGYVEVPFVIDTSEICAGSNDANIVCFEQLWQLDTEGTGRGEVMLDKHEDLTDENQTIYLTPRLETQMMDPVTNSQYGMIGEDVEFIDTVSYHRLRIGETYTVTGVLMDHQLNAPILDENGQVITASTTFVPDSTDGAVEVHYHLNTLRLIQEIGTVVDGVLIDAPREIVSFETVTSQSGFDFAIHADIEDDLQTIILGDIHSSAGDIQTSTRWCAAGLTTIQDTVHYRGLGPVEYTVVGSLHLVDYDEDGNPVDGGLIPARTGEVTEITYTWTPTDHEGDIVLDYKLDTSRYEGRDIIVFEELYYNGIRIIGHENYADVDGGFGMNNYEQTVHIPSVYTNAFSFQTGAQLLAVDENATINDFVYYGNVEVGRSYYVEGQLWACYTDENGFIHSTAIPAEQGGRQCSDTFTATAKSGSVEIQFTIDSTVLQGLHYDYIVVTERLIDVGSGVCVGNHGSLTDQNQTIYVPDVHTTASTTTGRTFPETSTEPVMVTVSDRVFYENLIPNKSYTVVGNLQYARTDADGNITESGALVQNGTPVTASLTFTPTSPSGYVDLTFNVDARSIMSQDYDRIVAFEDLYFGPEGVRVAVHADITDEDQTVRVPDMETTALGVNDRHTVAASANTTIRDTVAYYGLTPGREYRLETDLMSSRTNGSIAHVTTVFTPDTPDGVVTVELTADLSGYQTGDRIVVFENMYDQPTGLLIKSHMDWDDDDQTVTITDHPETGVLDSNGFGYIALAIAIVVAGGFSIFLVNNKKSKKGKLDSENQAES